MFVCECYKSIQGEGLLTGTESVFLRTSGCNLRCDFCDTPYSSWKPEGQQRTIDQVVQDCQLLNCRHMVLTGGEPMLQKEIVELTDRLANLGFHITIETAGTIDRPVKCDLMSISPKLSNSTPAVGRAGQWSARHENVRYQPDVITSLIERFSYQLKFVVDQPGDCQEILEYLKAFPQIRSDRVLLMPQGIIEDELSSKEPWIKLFCQQHQFQLCRRMHIVWFGNQRGT